MTQEQSQTDGDSITWQDFVVKFPPGKLHKVSQAVGKFYTNAVSLNTEDIFDYCDSEECKGYRFFKNISRGIGSNGEYLVYHTHLLVHDFVYKCKNCNKFQRIFVLKFESVPGDFSSILKVGQFPVFGPPIPSRAISLIGADRELFLKGRRAENQGLGIAAFAYYRRIIENQWQRFLDEIIKVGNKTGLDPSVLAYIEGAKTERQFDKAVKSMGDAIPPMLKMNGQNPITLLYSALSAGIHEQSDEECLELAGHIRVIIYELAERLNSALQEHNELDAAVKRLVSRKNPQSRSE